MAYSSRYSQARSFAPRTTGRFCASMILPMRGRSPSDKVLIENIKALQQAAGWSNRVLANKSGVSDRMIGKIFAGDASPSTLIIDKLAAAFGLDGWQLLIPDLQPELFKNGRFDRLFQAYTDADEDGRRVMDTAADYVAKHGDPSSNDEGQEQPGKPRRRSGT